MFRIDTAPAAPALSAPAAPGTPGYFTEGDPTSGTPATTVSADFLNMVQEEMMAVVVAGGVTPSKTTRNQVLTALQALFPSIAAIFGVGQSYHDLTTATGPLARAVNTTYTNSTGRMIEVQVAMTTSAAGWYTWTVDGLTMWGAGTYGTTNGGTVIFKVPAGKTYSVGCTNGSPTLVQWVELR